MGRLNVPHLHINLNKHVVVTAVCVAVVLGVGGIAAKSGHDMTVKAQQLAAEDAKQREAAAAEHNATVHRLNADIGVECSKERAYYNLLTLAQRKQVMPPDCSNITVDL